MGTYVYKFQVYLCLIFQHNQNPLNAQRKLGGHREGSMNRGWCERRRGMAAGETYGEQGLHDPDDDGHGRPKVELLAPTATQQPPYRLYRR